MSIKVSVLTVTYNHERYLAQAIESVLMQELDSYELVIGEDCSTDGTLEIARAYARDHPERIRLLETDRNLGGRANFVRTWRECRGEYFVLLDGDDYMTTPDKLAAQVELLDDHPECATCFHASAEVDEEGGEVAEPNRPWDRRSRYSIDDLLVWNFMNSCTVMYRRERITDFPDWFWDAPVADWPLHALSARHGEIGYIDEVMAAHRNHVGGIWARKGAVDQVRTNLRTQEFLLTHVLPEREEALRAKALKDHFGRAGRHERRGELDLAREYLRWCRAQPGRSRVLPRHRFWPRYARVAWKARGPARAEAPS